MGELQSGWDALSTVGNFLYPDQDNVRQATAMVKFWLGGPDPIDFVRYSSAIAGMVLLSMKLATHKL